MMKTEDKTNCQPKVFGEQIRIMLCELRELVVENLPIDGGFESMSAGFDINDKEWRAKRFWLKVEQIPEGLEQSDVKRRMDLVATDGMRQCHIMVECGEKQKLMDRLADDGFADYLISCAKRLDDVLRH